MAFMLGICLSLFVLSLVISCPLVGWLIGRANRLGHVDQPGTEAHKEHDRAVPNIGGIGIFAATAGPLAAAMVAGWAISADRWSGFLAPVGEHIAGLRSVTPMGLALVGALTAMHVMGRIDDRSRLSARVKLGVQLIVAAVLVCGFDMRVLHLLDGNGPGGIALSMVISVLWICVVTNAMNMLDNMDGLSAGVGAVIAGMYLAATIIGGQWFVAALSAMLLGALLGFLVFNFPPAKVFMGDGGSLVMGMLLAVISIRTTYFNVHDPVSPGDWYGLAMPLMVMAVPLYDFVSVTLIRLSQGRSPFVGDRNHFSHRLVRKGLSVRAAVVVIYLCTLATGISGVMLSSLTYWQAMLAAGQTAAVIAVLALLEYGGRQEQ
jgi:UDP-GlcNAc:undecaprenyl-phosphate GlcNAc-1-phosphate transferase